MEPYESPVLMQRISKFHIPAQLSGIHVPVSLSHLLQTCQEQSTDYHVPQTEKQHILGKWDSETDPLGKLQFKIRPQISEYRHLLVSQQFHYREKYLSVQLPKHWGFLPSQAPTSGLMWAWRVNTKFIGDPYLLGATDRARKIQDAWGHVKWYWMPETTESV